MPRVHLPDGRVVNFPEGMSTSQIQAAIEADAQGQRPAPEPGLLSRIGSFAKDSLPAIGGLALPIAGAAAGPIGWTGLGLLALLGGMGGAGYKHVLNAALDNGEAPTSEGAMMADMTGEGLKSASAELLTAGAAPYLGLGMKSLGQGQQALAGKANGMLRHGAAGVAGALYGLARGQSAGDVAKDALAGSVLASPRVGRMLESVGGRMAEPAFADAEALPGYTALRRMLGLDIVPLAENLGPKAVQTGVRAVPRARGFEPNYPPEPSPVDPHMPNTFGDETGAFGDAAEPFESSLNIDRYMPNKFGDEAPLSAAEPSVPQSLKKLLGLSEETAAEPTAAITDPSRMIPGIGETSETVGPGGNSMLSRDRTIDLADTYLKGKLGPGAGVKSLNKLPAPSGSDPIARALRQRRHVAESAAKKFGTIVPSMAALAGLQRASEDENR